MHSFGTNLTLLLQQHTVCCRANLKYVWVISKFATGEFVVCERVIVPCSDSRAKCLRIAVFTGSAMLLSSRGNTGNTPAPLWLSLSGEGTLLLTSAHPFSHFLLTKVSAGNFKKYAGQRGRLIVLLGLMILFYKELYAVPGLRKSDNWKCSS